MNHFFSGLANANSEYDYYDSDFEPWTQPSKEVPNPALDVVTTESATGKLVIIAPVSTEEFKPPALTTEESITETYWEYFYDYGDSTVIVERVPTTTTVAPSTTTEPVAPVSSSSTIKQTTSVKNTNPPITSRAERLTPTTVTVPSADFEDEDVTETTIALTTSTKKAKTQPTTTAAPAIDEDDEFILTTETPKSKISLKSPSASTRTSSDTWPVVTNSKRTTTKIPKATPRTTRTTSTTTAAPFVEYDYEYEEFITEAPTTTTTTTTTTATPTKTKIKDLKEYLKRKALEREMRTSTEDPFLAILATIDPAILLKDSSTRAPKKASSSGITFKTNPPRTATPRSRFTERTTGFPPRSLVFASGNTKQLTASRQSGLKSSGRSSSVTTRRSRFTTAPTTTAATTRKSSRVSFKNRNRFSQ